MKKELKNEINLGFWGKLKKPIFALAPMSDVTDSPFRQVVAKRGKPDVFFTEFVSADGLCSDGRKNLLKYLYFTKKEKPIVAQLFGAHPETFSKSARLIQELGFDGIDLNMGCPFKAIEKQGAGAALIRNPKLAQKIIQETKKGAGRLPVSIKTRIGYESNVVDQWIPYLLAENPAVITIHGRMRKEKSRVPAHWDVITQAAKIVKKSGSKTLILGNGDISSLEDGREKIKESGVDGVMVGRAVIKNPWFFNPQEEISLKEKLTALVEHVQIFEKVFKNKKNFQNLRKFFSSYVSDFPGAKSMRMKLMNFENARDVEKVIKLFLKEEHVSL